MKAQILWGLILLLCSACGIHDGMITGTHPAIDAREYTYVDVAVGYSDATYWFGIGGLDKDVLIHQAKQNMMISYPLQPNQILANTTLDIKTLLIWPYRRVEATAVADVIQLDKTYNITMADTYRGGELLSNDHFKLGEQVLLIEPKSGQLAKGRIVALKAHSAKVYTTLAPQKTDLLMLDYDDLFKTIVTPDLEQLSGYKVGDTMLFKRMDKNQIVSNAEGVIIAINQRNILYQMSDGTIKSYMHNGANQ